MISIGRANGAVTQIAHLLPAQDLLITACCDVGCRHGNRANEHLPKERVVLGSSAQWQVFCYLCLVIPAAAHTSDEPAAHCRA